MNLEFKDLHVFLAGGLGSIGKSVLKNLMKENIEVTVLFNQNKEIPELNEKKIKFTKVNYGNYSELYKFFLKNSKVGKYNSLVSTVGTGKAMDEYPHSENEIKRLWDINYFYNRNLIVSITEFLNDKPEFNLNNNSSHILTSSIASNMNVNAPIEYCTSKAALEALIKSLSSKVAPSQRINAIKPGHIFAEGGIWDKKLKNNPELVKEMIIHDIPLLRLGNTDDITSLIIFLLSNKSNYITGNCFNIDGGLTRAR